MRRLEPPKAGRGRPGPPPARFRRAAPPDDAPAAACRQPPSSPVRPRAGGETRPIPVIRRSASTGCSTHRASSPSTACSNRWSTRSTSAPPRARWRPPAPTGNSSSTAAPGTASRTTNCRRSRGAGSSTNRTRTGGPGLRCGVPAILRSTSCKATPPFLTRRACAALFDALFLARRTPVLRHNRVRAPLGARAAECGDAVRTRPRLVQRLRRGFAPGGRAGMRQLEPPKAGLPLLTRTRPPARPPSPRVSLPRPRRCYPEPVVKRGRYRLSARSRRDRPTPATPSWSARREVGSRSTSRCRTTTRRWRLFPGEEPARLGARAADRAHEMTGDGFWSITSRTDPP